VTADRHAATAPPALTIRPLTTAAELRRCVEIQREVWGADFSEVVPPAILTIAPRLGGILSGAFDEEGALLGFVFGLTGVRGGVVLHWSDMLAVRPGNRDRGVGDALKRHQRERLLHDGVAHVQWTFDPLESRNAHINFARLGVVAREYVRDFYCLSDSPLHGEIGTDRIIVEWAIASDRVARRLSGAALPPRHGGVAAVPVINLHETGASGPRSGSPRLTLDEPRLLLAVPSDIQALKDADPALARDWRAVTRAAFEAYLRSGYVAVEFVRGDAVGYYLLERAPELS
jgi:predicted GNAT superfamily acetyltransferase